MKKAFLLFILLAFSPLMAGKIVLKNGKTIVFEGKYEVEGNFIKWKKNGTPYHLPLKVVDLERCSQEGGEKKKVKVVKKEEPKEKTLFDQVKNFRGGDDISLRSDQDAIMVDEDTLKKNRKKTYQPKRKYFYLREEEHMIASIMAGNLDMVMSCIANGVPLQGDTYTDQEYPQPFHLAILREKKSILEALALHGANVDLPDEDGNTPLMGVLANEVVDEQVAMLLVKHGANVSAIGKPRTTPMHMAMIRKVSIELVDEMMKHAPQLNITNDKGETPLTLAIATSNTAAAERFLEYGANPNAEANGETPLTRAARMDNSHIISSLLDRGANPNKLNRQGFSALAIAISRDNLISAKKLLDVNAKVIAQNKTVDPLELAIARGARLVAEHLLAEAGEDGLRSHALESIREGQVESLAMLMDKGVALDLKDKDGNPPLIIAAKGGHLKMVGFLLEQGANPYEEGTDGKTAFAHASGPEKDKIRSLLKKAFRKIRAEQQ